MPQSTETVYDSPASWSVARLDVLRGMSQQAIDQFDTMMRTTKRRRGEWIFVLGDPAESIYLLQEGRVKITTFREDGHELLHKIIGPDEIFGDISTILGTPRTTSAQVCETSLLCEI